MRHATMASHPLCAPLAATLLALPLLCPRPASGQEDADFQFVAPRFSIGVRGGYAISQANSDIYDFLTGLLTLERSDFDGPVLTADFSWHALSWLDAMVGFEVAGGLWASSEYREFVDLDDLPIAQRTRLTQVPITFSAKAYPLGRGKQVGQFAWIRKTVVPYVGAGFGPTWYELKQDGDFIDFQDPSCQPSLCIFEGSLKTSGWAFAGHTFIGVDIKITHTIGAVVEGRYYWANGDVGGSFERFGPIDLDGARITAGVNIKL
jgi:hypothetical protein